MNSIAKDLADIRRLPRIAPPESDTYLYRLGVAVYGFASFSSFKSQVMLSNQSPWRCCNAWMS
jgi:hypothetical protein